jgi:G3E family GTPase
VRPAPRPTGVAVSVLASVDPVLRESALAGLVLGSPSTVAVRHDLATDVGVLRRVVIDATGVVEDERVPLEHACLSCCVREDAIPTLARLAADGRWTDVVLALPATAEPLPAVRALEAATGPDGPLATCRLATTVALTDLDEVEADLLGDTLCGERGLELADDDERAIGEASAAQLEQVDLVVTTGDCATGSGLVDRLRGIGTRRIDGLHGLSAGDLAAGHHDRAAAERRAHPLGARGGEGVDGAGPLVGRPGDRSWTLVLESPRPFAPERLLQNVEGLGTGPIRARGVFHVANRPDSACLWDSAGGQTCIADLGPWDEVAAGAEAHTRICVVGAGDEEAAHAVRERIVESFFAALTTDDEAADGGIRWLGRADVLSPWLGRRTAA